MASKTKIGNSNIVKKMFGTKEVVLEKVNGKVVYQKAASGYSVSVLLSFVGQDASSDARARVYDGVNGNLLYTFDSVYDMPSANVTTTTGKIYILIDNTYIPYIESYSTSNGITFNSWLQGEYDVDTPSVWILFDVAANGSISVEGYTDYA